MTVEAIKEAIAELPSEDLTALTSWLVDRDWDLWDQQMKHDFSAGGRGMPLLAELEREIDQGKTLPMNEALAERPKPRV
ncbi:MAG: hypothetical protein ACR2NN_02705 [Bryobacteraceae bacterium]